MVKALISIFLVSLGLLWSCQNTEILKLGESILTLPATPYSYDTTGTNNNVPTLGRVMFYDTRLSVNNSVSCATCHKQARAFADNVAFSSGFEGKPTVRNSMPIQNLGSIPTVFPNDDIGVNQGPSTGVIGTLDTLSLFWDGREKLLKAMVLRPITNHVEMGISDLNALAVKLSLIPDYQNLFTKAYGSSEVTEMKIADALSQFLLNIKSDKTKFDLYRQNAASFSAQEVTGLNLFEDKYNCNSCHQVDELNGYQLGGGFVNIGLDKVYQDVGHADVTGLPTDVGKFKIPTLRNVALTAPYMHDGRFNTLDEVVDHYSSGIQDSPNLDFRLLDADGHPVKMNISDADKQAIIAFLNTLTDYSMITDPRFSNPFVPK